MSGDGPTLPYQPPPTASTAPASTVPPVVPPIRRHLAFASTNPPFVHPDDYHRFSPSKSRGIVADQEVEAIIVRFPFVRQTYVRILYSFFILSSSSEAFLMVLMTNRKAQQTKMMSLANGQSSPGVTSISNSPFQTPVSAKGGRINNRSKTSKANKSIGTNVLPSTEELLQIIEVLKCLSPMGYCTNAFPST
ncbi:hypothetical protein GOBAR_DD35651 [Gossypium barbadense]|nr:hypothetical protein GOBAR_DD35651 [Gossypium barbadense]